MPKKITKKVSVVCAAYNEERLFEEHLKSLVNQTYKNKEIIIVDDGSTDKTGEIGKRFAKRYKSVRYFRIEHIDGYGCVRPRIEGIKHATGSVLCIVDADGYYGKNNIRDGIRKLFSEDSVAAIVPRMHAWKPYNFIAKYRAMVYESRFLDPEAINKAAMNAGYSPWLMKRGVYDEVGGYNIMDAYSEDVRLARRILNADYKIVHEPKCHWKHNLGESTLDVFKKNFNIGRMHSAEGKVNLKNSAKTFYFLLPIIFVISSLFNYLLFLLILLHMLPMAINGLRIFIKVIKFPGKWNSFYSPVVSYAVNIPYALGIIAGVLKPYKK